MLDAKFIFKDTLKMLARAACVYLALAAIYVHESHAGSCISYDTVRYAAASSGGVVNQQVFTSLYTSTTTPNTCGLFALTGTDYTGLLNKDSGFQTDINTLNGNVTTVNNNLTALTTRVTSVEPIANNALTTANEALTIANEALTKANQALSEGGGGNSTNPDNILNINAEDAQTLLYATLALFVAAFVGRMLRRAVDSQPSYIGD